MGARTGTALRLVQWFTRAIEFCCAAIILAIFAYFLATLASHSLSIGQWIRAVEGIAGAAVIYTVITLLLLCCVAGHPLLSPIFIFLDICFMGAFIYLAAANRDGARSCDGQVNTPLGRGNANTNIVDNGQGGVITLSPTLREACKMQSACLAVAIVGLLFFMISAIFEVLLMRNRRKARRYGTSPAVNGYTSGYGKPEKQGFFSRFGRKKRDAHPNYVDNENTLPEHTHPDAVRDSYRPASAAVADPDALPPSHNQPVQPMSGVNTGYGSYGYNNKPDAPPEAGAYHTEYANPTTGTTGTGAGTTTSPAPARYPPGNYRYDDGVYDRS